MIGVKVVPGETEGTILKKLVSGVEDELGEVVLIKADSGWMRTKMSEEKKRELKKLGLYDEYGFLQKEMNR